MTSTEHHMARMGAHPAPRFEFVHKPRVLVADPVDPWSADKTATNPQPWSARFIGANGAEVWRTSETYVDVRDVERAIALLAEALGSQALFEGAKPKKDAPRPAEIAIVRTEVEA